MIIKRLKIAIAFGIFAIILSFISVYKFVTNDKIMALLESFSEKFSEISFSQKLESNKNDSAADKKSSGKDESEKKKPESETTTTTTNKP